MISEVVDVDHADPLDVAAAIKRLEQRIDDAAKRASDIAKKWDLLFQIQAQPPIQVEPALRVAIEESSARDSKRSSARDSKRLRLSIEAIEAIGFMGGDPFLNLTTKMLSRNKSRLFLREQGFYE